MYALQNREDSVQLQSVRQEAVSHRQSRDRLLFEAPHPPRTLLELIFYDHNTTVIVSYSTDITKLCYHTLNVGSRWPSSEVQHQAEANSSVNRWHTVRLILYLSTRLHSTEAAFANGLLHSQYGLGDFTIWKSIFSS